MEEPSYLKPSLQKALTCPLCNSSREFRNLFGETFGAGPYGNVVFEIYRCATCGPGITDRVPPEGLYESRASFDFPGDDSGVAAVLKRMVANRDVRSFVGRVELGHCILDYDCGNGAFALSMRRVFPKSIVWATECHAEGPPSTHGPFDFVLCGHVLEHTYSPVEFLRRMNDLMSPGSVLMLEVPNLKAPLRKIFGKYWDGYYVPYHPVHFSGRALRQTVITTGYVP
jgi:hypothetical protein